MLIFNVWIFLGFTLFGLLLCMSIGVAAQLLEDILLKKYDEDV